MDRWRISRGAVLVIFLFTLLLTGGRAVAAGDEGKKEQEDSKFQIGLGGGLNRFYGDGIGFVQATLRWRPGEGVRQAEGYVELDLNYWSDSETIQDEKLVGKDTKDLYAGANAVLVLNAEEADYYVGLGMGVHFIQGIVDTDTGDLKDDQRLGGNLHFGVDLNVSDAFSVFGQGRIDLLQGAFEEFDTLQPKIAVGIRFK